MRNNFTILSILFCKGENFTVNRAQSSSLTQTFFLQNQGLTGTDNQYNKISEESDTAEDHVNSDDY
jgi:hypothetical protein